MDCELLDNRLALVENVGPEVEFLLHQGILLMRPCEVFP